MTTLAHAVAWYFECRETTPEYRRSINYRVRQLEVWAGRKLELADLDDSLVNRWVMYLQDQGKLASKTVKGYRDAVLQVWRAAAEEGIVANGPKRIRRIKVPRATPVAWHLPELSKLLEACQQIPGVVAHTTIPRGLWFEGHLRVLWDTALRRSDGIRLRWSDLRPGNVIYVQQSKTGEPVPRRLGDDTLDVLWAIRQAGDLGPDDELCPWPGSWRQYEHWLRWLVARAGIRPGRTKYIRRASASYCELETPGSAKAILGHKTNGLAEQYYLDPSIVQKNIPLPPRIA